MGKQKMSLRKECLLDFDTNKTELVTNSIKVYYENDLLMFEVDPINVDKLLVFLGKKVKENKEFLSIREAAAYTSTSFNFINNEVGSGNIPYFELKTKKIIKKSDLISYMYKNYKVGGLI